MPSLWILSQQQLKNLNRLLIQMIIKSQRKFSIIQKSNLKNSFSFSLKSVLKESVHRSLTGKNGITILELSKFPNLNKDTLDSIVKNFPHIRHIDLSCCFQVNSEWFNTLASAYGNTIQTLNLEFCYYIRNEDLAMLFGNRNTVKFGECNLNSLVLSYTNVSDLGMKFVASNCPNLQVLKLQGMKNITDLTLSMIAKHCPKIYALDIRDCECITDYGVQIICQELKNIEELYVAGCNNISNKVLSYLSYYSKNLRILDIKNTKISGEGVNLIARTLTNLETLKINGLSVEDDHIRPLFELKNLKSLDLSFCFGINIGFLKEILNSSSSLNELFLFGLMSIEEKQSKLRDMLLRRGCGIGG